MLHAYVARFDVTNNLKNFLFFLGLKPVAWLDVVVGVECLHLHAKALFSSEKISAFHTVALSFVCIKYYPIID